MKNRLGRPHAIPMEFIVSAALIVAAIFVMRADVRISVRLGALALIFGASIAYFLIRDWYQQRMTYIAGRVLSKNEDQLDRYGCTVLIPTAVCRASGLVIWSNPAFYLVTMNQSIGRSIYRLLPLLSKPDKDNRIRVGNVSYLKEMLRTTYKKKEYVIYRLIEPHRSNTASEKERTDSAVVCQIEIDNYDDVTRGISQSKQSDLRSAIDRIVGKQAQKLHGLLQSYDRDKYIIVFERRKLPALMQTKFDMLEKVRELNTGIPGVHPTLSLGLGVGSPPDVADSNALKALEMALSRGGDQAVLKDKDGFKFFGGIQQGREKRTQVKTRMFAKALRSLMEQGDRLIVMGHHVPDLDCMSAALGLAACARSINKKVYIVLDRPNAAIESLVTEMRETPTYKGVLISPAEASAMLDDRAILAVVDTQIGSLTIAPQLLDEAVTIVVIDHHVRGTEYIESPTLLLHEPYASSTAEMVTEIIEYFGDDVLLTPLDAESLLAGISVDTKGFSFKTGERTFEAASYLRRIGADTTKIRHLFQDDLDVYTERANVVEKAEILKDGVAISTCPKDARAPQLLAAQAADALLGIRGVEASFVLCQIGTETIISGRSLGQVNVQRILEKLGGGGHATIAGAQLKDTPEAEAKRLLINKIEEYEKEV